MNRVIEHINDSIMQLLKSQFNDADAKTYPIAESVALRGDEDITFPAIILPNGECISVYGETDKHDVILYHRLNDISFQEETGASFGSSRCYTETEDMSLIVFGKRECISPFKTEMIARKAISETNKCTLYRSDFNALQIFATEYAGVTYFMSPEYFLFKINYRITDTYQPRCE